MAFHEYTIIPSLSYIFPIIVIVIFIIFIYIKKVPKTIVPTNWPLIGMIPGILLNVHQLHNYVTDLLKHSGGTFVWKGLWFANMDLLITSNPTDVHYMLSKNFISYPKGEHFRKIFDILGDGIFNSDGELWKINHKVMTTVLRHPEFQDTFETILWNKVEKGLLPLLNSTSELDLEVDLQDVFKRFSFDVICKLLFDNDHETLSLNISHVPCLKAIFDAEEAILYRHITPQWIWKLQQLFRVGKEKKLKDATKILDQFIYECIAEKENINYIHVNHDEKFLFFRNLIREINGQSLYYSDLKKTLRDALLSLMSAGGDTTSTALSWFFYALTQNPKVEDKIREEIHKHLGVQMKKRWNVKEIDKMVYFHGALCESLRLFPPIPFNHKSPSQNDILPSGHKVDRNTKIILPIYSMGRMKTIWGEDCMEFKPERWINFKTGGIIQEPSYKFLTFSSGPRICIGKSMSLTQLKIVSATIIHHYHIQLLEGHLVLPFNSMVLHMKHGLKVRLTKKSEV